MSTMIEFDKNAVGRTVRRLRLDRNLSQEVFSGLSGLARSHIAMIESGKKQANFETIWKIANACNILPSELVKLIEEETQKL